jgi:hypothetical protein
MVVPLSAPFTVLLPDNEGPVCGLFIVDCQRGTAARLHVFADLFNLTSAQVRVLAQVISGEGLTMAARRLNMRDQRRDLISTIFCKKPAPIGRQNLCGFFLRQQFLGTGAGPSQPCGASLWDVTW